MRKLYPAREPVRHLPLAVFLAPPRARRGDPDPAPRALLFLAVVFTLSAAFWF